MPEQRLMPKPTAAVIALGLLEYLSVQRASASLRGQVEPLMDRTSATVVRLAQADTGQTLDDPNFPHPSSDSLPSPALKVRWRYIRGNDLLIEVIDPKLRSQGGPQPEYLGYNSQTGQSLFTRSETGEILAFNLKNNSLEVAYKEKNLIPLAVLNNLHGGDIDYLILAKGGKPRNQQPEHPRELTPVELAQRQRERDAASRQGGGVVSQQDAAQAIAMLGLSKGRTAPRPALSGTITGTGATLLAGSVLAFRTADGAQLKYKVERQPVPNMTGSSSAAPSGDIAGTWLAFDVGGDPNDNKIISIDSGGGVTAREMDAGLKASFEMVRKLAGSR